MKLLNCMLDFVVGIVKFCRNIFMISFLFLIAIVILTIVMPNNVQTAIEIFKNLLKIP